MVKKGTKRRAPGEGGLFQRGDGMWVGRVWIVGADGKRHGKVVYSRDKGKAAEKLDELRQDVKKGRVVAGPSMTLGDYLDHWLTTMRGPEVTQAMQRHYEGAIRLYIKPHIGKVKLNKLTTDHVFKMIRAVQATGSTRNAQKAHQALRTALQQGVPHYVAYNVAVSVPHPKHAATEVEGLPLDVARHIIRTAITADENNTGGPLLATRWAAQFMTGSRRGEMLGLQWDRVDFDGGKLDLAWQLRYLQQSHGCGEPLEVGDDGRPTAWPCGRTRPGWCPDRSWKLPPGTTKRELHRSLVLTRPKTKAGKRVVPLIPPLAELLKVHYAQTVDQPNPHNLVWHHRDGRPIDPTRDDEHWHALMRRAGVIGDQETIGTHVARHTAATLLLAYGADAHVIKAAIGHTAAATTQIYQHVDLSMARSSFEHLAVLLTADGD